MSSLLVVQEQRQMTFAVDTACSRVICETSKEKSNKSIICRYKDKVADKVHQVGKDMVFVAGMNTYTDPLEEKLKDFLDKRGHINIELLKQHLIKNYPYSNSICKQYGYSDIGIVILQIINNESIIIKLDQASDFVPSESRAKQNEVKLSVDGFDNKKIYDNGSKFLNRLSNFGWRSPEALITIYQNSYSEGVGNSIRVYKMDWSGCSLLKDHKLTEEGLTYVNFDADGREYVDADKVEFTAHLQGAAGTFTGTVQAGQVIGGTVEGATITGSTINGTVINGCTIYGGEFISDNPNNQQSTTIEGGVVTTNALICEGGLGNNFTAMGNYLQMWHPQYQEMFHLDGMGNMMCKTLKVGGWDVITSGNIPPIPNSTNDLIADLTEYGNIDFIGNVNGASVDYVQANFERISSSDKRLKQNFKSLSELPDELFLALVPKQYEFICDPNNKGIVFGLVAQEVEEAFTSFGLNAFDYNLVELTEVRKYYGEDTYVADQVHRINYNNFHAWNMYMIQKLYSEKSDLKNRVAKLEQLISQMVGSEGLING